MPADADSEQAVERRSNDLDRAACRFAVGPLGGAVAAREFRDSERPAHEPERLDERRRRAADDGRYGQRGRSSEDHGKQRSQWQHREGA